MLMHETRPTSVLQNWKNALLLMRIPFSIYLMPIFWLAASQNILFGWERGVLTFLILHLLVYPGSNGYNSYHDRDTAPVGGLASPPAVNQQLWYLIILTDVLALGLSYLLGWLFLSWVLAYILASKAYSWPSIRLKGDPYLGTAIVVLMQGAGTYYMVLAGLGVCSCEYGNLYHIGYAVGASLTLLGNYPLTQVYQHESDAEHGDQTLSRLLGVIGTFWWALAFTIVGGGLIALLLYLDFGWKGPVLLMALQLPANLHQQRWFAAVRKDLKAANHQNAMRLNQLASLGFSAALVILVFAERWQLW